MSVVGIHPLTFEKCPERVQRLFDCNAMRKSEACSPAYSKPHKSRRSTAG